MEDMIPADVHTVAGPSGINVVKYGRLLAKFTPKVIQSEAENEEALAIVESLMVKGDQRRSAEEDALFELLVSLIERFEQSAWSLPEGDPAGVLKLLIEGRGVATADLAHIFGSEHGTSEVLARNRAISIDEAKRLGNFFKVSPAAFI
jgi:HTH-type transcriptional regulator / antitoxin HigA